MVEVKYDDLKELTKLARFACDECDGGCEWCVLEKWSKKLSEGE